MSSKSLCCLDMMTTPRTSSFSSLVLKCTIEEGKGGVFSLCILDDQNLLQPTPKHFLYTKDLSDFKHRIFRQSDAKNSNLARNVKRRFCDFLGSHRAAQNYEVQANNEQMDDRDQYELSSEDTRLQFEMSAPVVVYADFELSIDDKNKHKPIMLSCLVVSRIPAIQTQLQFFHAPQEEESDLRPFIKYLIRLQVSVKKYLFDELPLENTPEIKRDYQSTSVCPFCCKKLEDDKVKHHAHVAGSIRMASRPVSTRLGSLSAPVVPSAIYNSHSTRRTIVCPCTSTMDRTTISHSS